MNVDHYTRARARAFKAWAVSIFTIVGFFGWLDLRLFHCWQEGFQRSSYGFLCYWFPLAWGGAGLTVLALIAFVVSDLYAIGYKKLEEAGRPAMQSTEGTAFVSASVGETVATVSPRFHVACTHGFKSLERTHRRHVYGASVGTIVAIILISAFLILWLQGMRVY